MKKSLATAAALMLALSLAACSADAADSVGTPAAEPAADAAASEAPASEAAENHSVIYEVTGDGASAGNITYMTMTGGNTGTEQANAAPLPFTKEIPLEKAGMFDASVFSLTAQSDETGTTISCKITVDGEVKAEQTSTGPYALVSCSGF